MRRYSLLMVLAIFFTLLPPSTRAQSPVVRAGDLDVTFGGGDGLVSTSFSSFSDSGKDILRLPDGGFIVVGETQSNSMLVARYTSAGELDPAFGAGKGYTRIWITNGSVRAFSVALDPNGKIVVAGDAHYSDRWHFAVARLNPDGSRDTSFHYDGLATAAIGESDAQAYGVAVQDDGKIVAVGWAMWGGDRDYAIARFTASGSLDTAFTGDGFTTRELGNSYEEAYAVQVQSDGKILIVGRTGSGSSTNVGLVRLTTSGYSDSGFGTYGTVRTDVRGNEDIGSDVLVQADGKIVVGGSSKSGSVTDFMLLRYTSSGALDSSFGSAGKAFAAFDASAYAYGVAQAADGSLVLGGRTGSLGALARFTAAGSLDASFGTSGTTTFAHGASTFVYAVVTDGAGNIITGGSAKPGALFQPALARIVGTTVLNQVPVAQPDSYAAIADTPRHEALGVLANDTDADGHALSAILISSVAHGSVTLQPSGSFIYTPTIGFTGTDQFVYQAFDGFDASAPATVTLQVEPVNTPPVVTISTPAEGSVLAAPQVTVAGTATDEDGQIVSVLVNGAPATLNGTSFSAVVALDGGSQAIAVVAADEQGAVGTASRIVAFDNAGPAISILAPQDAQAVYALTPTISLEYADAFSSVDVDTLSATLTGSAGDTVAVDWSQRTPTSARGLPATPLTGDSTYTLTVELADSLGTSSQISATFYVTPDPVRITPPAAPPQASWVAGRVALSASCADDLIGCAGLPGAQVTLQRREGATTEDVLGTVLTGPDGFFAFPVDQTGTYWIRVEKDGYTYAQREVNAVQERSTSTSIMFLTPLDTAVTSCDTAGCEHSNSDDTIRIDIPAGAITDTLTVPVRATNFEQVEFLPSGELPPGTWETYAFNLSGDSEVAFTKPATVSLKNTQNLPPGTEVPMGYWNQTTHQWEHTGVATVDPSGQWLVGTITHFSNYDWNMPVAPIGADTEAAVQDEDTASTCNGEEGCWINYKSGTLEEWIDLPAVQVLDEQTAPQLRYATSRANPSQVIDVKLDVNPSAGATLGDHVTWELFIEGEKTEQYTFAADIQSAGEVGRYRYLWDGRNAQGERLPPGTYEYQVRLGIPYSGQYCGTVDGTFGGAPDCVRRASGIFVNAYEYEIVNGTVTIDAQDASALGAGWILKDQQRLYRDDAGRIMITDGRHQDEFIEVSLAPASGAAQYTVEQRSVLQPGSTVPAAPEAEEIVATEPTPVPNLRAPATSDAKDAEQGFSIQSMSVCGDINSSTTWTLDNSPYTLTCRVRVMAGATLTIEPGVTVQSASNGNTLDVYGTLIAEGTATNPITFTSSLATPAPGDWGGVRLLAGHQTSALRHVVVEYAYWGLQVQLSATSPSMTIEHSLIRHNKSDGLFVGVAAGAQPLLIKQNTFVGNGLTSLYNNAAVLINMAEGSADIRAVDNVASGNRRNAFLVGGFIRGTANLDLSQNPAMPMLLGSVPGTACLYVRYDGTLNISPGALIKADQCWLRVDGTLIAEGTEAAPISFTSIQDDSLGGDTGNDGPTTGTPPGPGVAAQWNGIHFYTGGNSSFTPPGGKQRLQHVRIMYADTGLFVQTAQHGFHLALEQSEVLTSGIGLKVNALDINGSIAVSQSRFADNRWQGMYIQQTAARILIEDNEFTGNGFGSSTSYGAAVYLRLAGAAGEIVAQGNSVSGNLVNGALFEGNIHGSLVLDWGREHSMPLVLRSNAAMLTEALVIEESGALWLTPGTIVKVKPTLRIDVIGALVADGTSTGQVIFTADSDYSVGGETYTPTETYPAPNPPAPNHWRGIYLRDSSADNVFDQAVVRYARDGLTIRTSDVAITATRFEQNIRGILIPSDVAIAPYMLRGNAFVGNTTAGIDNQSTIDITAVDNWWGDPSGPSQLPTNPPPANPATGSGDAVSIHVLYDPWLASDDALLISKTATDNSTLNYNLGDGSFTRVYPDGSTVNFNPDGTHAATVQPDGRTTAYTYNPDGTVAAVAITAPGRSAPDWIWTFQYKHGQLTQITDPAQRITRVEIDAKGDLSAVTFPDQSQRRFAYDQRHLLIDQTDQNGAVSSYTYDAYGRIQSVTEPAQAVLDPTTGAVRIEAPTRTFAPSETSYALINASAAGSVDQPAPAVQRSADIVDRVTYSRGVRFGITNEWGSWLESTDALSRTTTYQRDAADRITRQTNPDGTCVEYTYNAVGSLLSEARMPADQCAITNPAQRDPSKLITTSYTYEERFNRLKTATDPRGNTATYVYDYEEGLGAVGKIIRIEYPAVLDATGTTVTPTVSYTANALGLVETETNARGVVTRYVYTQGSADEAFGGSNARFASGVTPVPGLLTAIIEDDGGANLTSTFTNFDSAGNPGTISASGAQTTTLAYDALGRVVALTDTLGFVTTFSYDGRGNRIEQVRDYTADGVTGRNIRTTYTYNAADQLTGESTSADGLIVRRAIFYDANGKLAAEEDALGNRRRYVYDDADQLVAVRDPADQEVTITYTVNGEPENITDADGYVTHITYDAFGRQQTVTEDYGGLNLTTSYTYDASGNLTSVTDPENTVTRYDYDALNRRILEVSDASGSPLTTTYRYDANSNLRMTTDPRGTVTTQLYDNLDRPTFTHFDNNGLDVVLQRIYAADGTLEQVVDQQRGTVTKYAYDDVLRLQQVCVDHTAAPSAGLNLCTSYGYDRLGNQSLVTAPDSRQTKLVYNAFGLPVQRIDDAAGQRVTTYYGYDRALNQTSITDANGKTTSYTYTPRNERETQTFADSSRVRYTYDGRGNLKTRTDQDDQTITYTYDGAGRGTALILPDGSAQRFAYDGMGRVISATDQLNGHSSAILLAYDALGTVLTSTQTLDGHTWTVGYAPEYRAGRQTVSYPSGMQRVQEFDALGRLDAVRPSVGGAAVADYAYDLTLGVTSITRGNGLIDQLTYDAAGRVTDVTVSGGIADYAYAYNAASQRTSVQRQHAAGQPYEVYDYNSLGQLSAVWYGANAATPEDITSSTKQQHYTLDPVGNRLSVQDGAATTAYAPSDGQQLTDPLNRYTAVGGNALSTDGRGNVLNDGRTTYTYDLLNRQLSASGPDGSATYVYNAFNQRIAKVSGSTTTYFVYDTLSRVLETYDSSATLQARYTYGAGIDEVLTLERGGATYTYHRDGLGSISEITDASGALVERYTYDVYGTPTITDGAGSALAASSIANPYMFTGREYEPESGIYSYRARMYSPRLGRFLQHDPLGYVDGLNMYAYVGNDPVNWVDPLGLERTTQIRGGVHYQPTARRTDIGYEGIACAMVGIGCKKASGWCIFVGFGCEPQPVVYSDESVWKFPGVNVDLVAEVKCARGESRFVSTPTIVDSTSSLPTLHGPSGREYYLTSKVQASSPTIERTRAGQKAHSRVIVTTSISQRLPSRTTGENAGLGAKVSVPPGEISGTASSSVSETWGADLSAPLAQQRSCFDVTVYARGGVLVEPCAKAIGARPVAPGPVFHERNADGNPSSVTGILPAPADTSYKDVQPCDC